MPPLRRTSASRTAALLQLPTRVATAVRFCVFRADAWELFLCLVWPDGRRPAPMTLLESCMCSDETPRCQSSYKCVTPELLNLFCMLPSRVYRNGTIWKLRSSYSQQPVLYTGILPVYGDSLDAQRSWLIHLCCRLCSPCSACFFSTVLHTHACSALRQRRGLQWW